MQSTIGILLMLVIACATLLTMTRALSVSGTNPSDPRDARCLV